MNTQEAIQAKKQAVAAKKLVIELMNEPELSKRTALIMDVLIYLDQIIEKL